MKKLLVFVLLLSAFGTNAQAAFNFFSARTLATIEGTPFVIASKFDGGPSYDSRNDYLLFIDTKKGASNRVDFTKTTKIQGIEQVAIEELGINVILVSAKTMDLNGKKGLDWKDPKQLFILSLDGKEKQEIDTQGLLASTWVVNQTTGTLAISGRLDANKNGKRDKGEGVEIQIFDLKTLKLLAKY